MKACAFCRRWLRLPRCCAASDWGGLRGNALAPSISGGSEFGEWRHANVSEQNVGKPMIPVNPMAMAMGLRVLGLGLGTRNLDPDRR